MPASSNGITPEDIRDFMPPYRLSPDLLAHTFRALPAPPPGAADSWRHTHARRLIEEITGHMPANAPQARIAAEILIVREALNDTHGRANAPGLSIVEVCRLRRTAATLTNAGGLLERVLARHQQKPVPFFGKVAADEVDIAAVDEAWCGVTPGFAGAGSRAFAEAGSPAAAEAGSPAAAEANSGDFAGTGPEVSAGAGVGASGGAEPRAAAGAAEVQPRAAQERGGPCFVPNVPSVGPAELRPGAGEPPNVILAAAAEAAVANTAQAGAVATEVPAAEGVATEARVERATEAPVAGVVASEPGPAGVAPPTPLENNEPDSGAAGTAGLAGRRTGVQAGDVPAPETRRHAGSPGGHAGSPRGHAGSPGEPVVIRLEQGPGWTLDVVRPRAGGPQELAAASEPVG